MIPNPNYFEDTHPHNFNAIDGIGIELWTMTGGISFNNILIAYDEKVAEQFAEQTWRPRHAEEQKIAAAKEPVCCCLFFFPKFTKSVIVIISAATD